MIHNELSSHVSNHASNFEIVIHDSYQSGERYKKFQTLCVGYNTVKATVTSQKTGPSSKTRQKFTRAASKRPTAIFVEFLITI